MQFINYSNLNSPKMGKVNKEQLVSALLEHETKNKSRVDKLVEGLEDEVEFSTALSLFTDKLKATSVLSVVEKKEVVESAPKKDLTWESVLEKIEDMSEVNEAGINDPVLVAFRAAKANREKELAKPKRKPLYGKQRQKAEDQLWDISQDLKESLCRQRSNVN